MNKKPHLKHTIKSYTGLAIVTLSLATGSYILLKDVPKYLSQNLKEQNLPIAVLNTEDLQRAKSSEIKDKTSITVKTYFTNVTSATSPNDNDSWPKIALFVNNGDAYDGPYDYARCFPPSAELEGCGTPPSYENRLVDKFEVKGRDFVKITTIPYNKMFYGIYDNLFATKLSYVFYNDYWNPGLRKDRNLAIKKIEIYYNGKLLKSFDPQTPSYYPYTSENKTVKQSFYFDMGLVNDSDIENSDQNSFVNAFDKKDIISVIDNESRGKTVWTLNKEGSFNLVTLELSKLLSGPNDCPKGAVTEGDCDINLDDLLLILSQIMENKPYNAKFDLVEDGVIGVPDLLFIINIIVG